MNNAEGTLTVDHKISQERPLKEGEDVLQACNTIREYQTSKQSDVGCPRATEVLTSLSFLGENVLGLW